MADKRTLSHIKRDDKMTAEIVDLKRLLEKVRGKGRGEEGRGGEEKRTLSHIKRDDKMTAKIT